MNASRYKQQNEDCKSFLSFLFLFLSRHEKVACNFITDRSMISFSLFAGSETLSRCPSSTSSVLLLTPPSPSVERQRHRRRWQFFSAKKTKENEIEWGRLFVTFSVFNRTRLLRISYFRIWWMKWRQRKKPAMGSVSGSVGRAVASNTRGPRFESSHRQKFIYLYIEHLFTVNCVLKKRR